MIFILLIASVFAAQSFARLSGNDDPSINLVVTHTDSPKVTITVTLDEPAGSEEKYRIGYGDTVADFNESKDVDAEETKSTVTLDSLNYLKYLKDSPSVVFARKNLETTTYAVQNIKHLEVTQETLALSTDKKFIQIPISMENGVYKFYPFNGSELGTPVTVTISDDIKNYSVAINAGRFFTVEKDIKFGVVVLPTGGSNADAVVGNSELLARTLKDAPEVTFNKVNKIGELEGTTSIDATQQLLSMDGEEVKVLFNATEGNKIKLDLKTDGAVVPEKVSIGEGGVPTTIPAQLGLTTGTTFTLTFVADSTNIPKVKVTASEVGSAEKIVIAGQVESAGDAASMTAEFTVEKLKETDCGHVFAYKKNGEKVVTSPKQLGKSEFTFAKGTATDDAQTLVFKMTPGSVPEVPKTVVVYEEGNYSAGNAVIETLAWSETSLGDATVTILFSKLTKKDKKYKALVVSEDAAPSAQPEPKFGVVIDVPTSKPPTGGAFASFASFVLILSALTILLF